MSPEQARGEPASELSDVYALGVIAFEVLTGEHPFAVTSPDQMIAAHLQRAPRPPRDLNPDIAPELARLVERCLGKEPRHRPSARDIAAMLVRGA